MGQIIMGWSLSQRVFPDHVENDQGSNCILDTQAPRTPQEPNQPQTPPVDDLPPEPKSKPCGIFDCVNTMRYDCDLVEIKKLPEDF